MQQLTREQYWKLFNNLPEELQDMIFSEKTAENIRDIAERNDIQDTSVLAKCIGQVLLGVLLPDKLQEEIEMNLKLKKDRAQTVVHEINRFILYPVKPLLEELYKDGVDINKENATTVSLPKKKERSKESANDAYRETIE
jgi:hypothetical protein